MKVRTPIKVRYGETDMMGIVYHANYLLYFEDARTHFLEEAGMPYTEIEKRGIIAPIYSVDIKYRAPLRYGEEAFVVTRVVENASTRTTYAQDVFRADMDPETDRPLVSGLVTCCLVDRSTFRPVSIKRTFPELHQLYDSLLEPLD